MWEFEWHAAIPLAVVTAIAAVSGLVGFALVVFTW